MSYYCSIMFAMNVYKPHFSAVIIFLCLINTFCLGGDTITADGYLSGDQTIVSATGMFELGFFKPGNTPNYYIAIWYKNIPGKTVIWVANRDKPASSQYTTKLKISNGNLVIVSNGFEKPIWATNLDYNISKPVKAVLLDDGNLVLSDGSNSSSPLWQSFDHPTDTLMPNGKLGLNKVSKSSQVLTSWKNSEDPGRGLFSIERDPSASQFIMLWNKTQQFWTSGLWIPEQHIFSQVPELRFLKTQFYSFVYVDNDNESYISYSVHDSSIVTRLVMDVSGQLKQLTWLENSQQWVLFWTQPGQQCEVYSYCGVFGVCNQSSLPYCHCLQGFKPKSALEWDLNDYSGGCARKTKLTCETGRNEDKFLPSPGRVLPEYPTFVSVSSLGECESACLKNCSCTAYAYDDNGCYIWVQGLLNMRQLSESSGKILHVRIAASDVQIAHENNNIVIGILVGLGMGLVALFALFSVVYWRGKRHLLIATKNMKHSLTRFRYKDLHSATKNFSLKLGGGGFGSVFKGVLPDSTVIAVKRLESINNSQGEKQFRAEVSAIGTIQHVNLVHLRGFCSEGSKRLLVYEYMPNGSLNTHLFKKENWQILTWIVRFQIALGTARGLAYLHEKCRDCIIHCDIKPENILLDAEFCPKVADFGLAKLMGREFSRVLTTIRGTRGYLAPEWISGDAITTKADAYSYGMMLFELLSGRRNIQLASEGRLDFFPTWALGKITEGEDVLSIVDPVLEGEVNKDEVMKICKLACWCIQDDESQRPSMGQAVQVLEGILDIEMPSIPSSLQLFGGNAESPMFFSEFSSTQCSSERTGSMSGASVSQNSSTYVTAPTQV